MKLCGFEVGLNRPFFLIAGPCVVESETLALDCAATLRPPSASYARARMLSRNARPVNRPKSGLNVAMPFSPATAAGRLS